MTDKILVLTTTGSAEEAKKIGRGLVDRRLAACVNIVPGISSVYRWQGNVEESQEYLLMIKTGAEYFSRVKDTIHEMHSYAVPECIAIPVANGDAAYLNWIADSLQSGHEPG